MYRWAGTFALAALVVGLAVPWGARFAFRYGFFERAGQTRRRLRQRRPTHGGLVLAVAVGAGSLLAGPSQPVARATVGLCLVALVSGLQVDRGRGGRWWPRLAPVVAVTMLPIAGLRVPLTGSDAMDAVVTAGIAWAAIRGVQAMERTDGTAPLVIVAGGLALALVAIDGSDPIAPAATALVGAAGALVAYTWPPAAVRIGMAGPIVLGGALTAAGAAIEPSIGGGGALLVPFLAVLPLLVGAMVPAWDRRLSRRGVTPRLWLPVAAGVSAVGAAGLGLERFSAWVAIALAVVPNALLACIALTTARPRPEGWTSHRGRNLALGGLAIVALGAFAVVAGILLLDARRSMEVGRDQATAGLDIAREGELERAQQRFEAADVAFADAATALDNPIVRIGEYLPGVGPNLRNARTLADVGGDLSGTAVAVAERAGADDLLVVDGRFPIEAAREVSAELTRAVAILDQAADRLDEADSPLLVGDVRAGATDVGDRIRQARRDLDVVEQATRIAPDLLGATGDRRWMVAVLTPSELRGAGGLAGDYAELRASDGDLELVETLGAFDLNQATDAEAQRAVLPAIYERRYQGFRLGRFWQNLSATPDIPTFGSAVASAYPLLPDGGPVDGLLVLDPYAIAALLEITGPITVPNWPVRIGSENAASVLLFEHYDRLTDGQIERFQGDLIEVLVDELTSGSLPPVSVMASVLGPAVTGGHLRLWSQDEDAQALFRRIEADGALGRRADGSDFVELVTQNGGENKIDWYLRRSLTYQAVVDPGSGAISATATVTLTNTAPSSGVSEYVIGETGGPADPGENELEVTLFTPHAFVLVIDGVGAALPVNRGRERGLNAITVRLEIPAGGAVTVRFRLEGFLEPTDGRYRLRVGRQPTVAPDALAVSIDGTNGWELPDPATAEVQTEADRPVHISVRFER